MADSSGHEIGSSIPAVRRQARRTQLTDPGLVVLALGAAIFVAGCYRGAVELTEGRVHQLVPIAAGAPLAAEFLLLVALFVLAAAGLMIAASHRRTLP